MRVRLAGIDSPEKGQAFGKKAKARTAELAIKKDVELTEKGKDRYGRVLADVRLPDGRILNRVLVQEGWAWVYRRYSQDPELLALESAARSRRLGVWADEGAKAPWTYRAESTR